ncbi:MAG: protein-methionine-sulfoxide reductase catalytic subunit MsrP [Acidobacteriota bacterium]
MLIRKRPGWEIAEREATDESLALSRRSFLATLGYGALGAMALGCDFRLSGAAADPKLRAEVAATIPPARPPFPFTRVPRFTLDRSLSDEIVAATYNNFYEFSAEKDQVWQLVDRFKPHPWTVEVGGLVSKPQTFAVEDLMRTMPMEERLYRHRCVEAWGMAVPWTGFPLRALLERVEPLPGAQYVRFLTFNRPEQAPGMKSQPWYRWPYFEGLRLDEAMNELTMLVTGIYGHELPKQHGAPIRVVVPWKYGYKSAKSIVKIELVDRQPPTFWETESPNEFPFESNVNPARPHPRWSQSTERLIGSMETRKTLLYNGYGEYVAHLYA